MARTPGSNSNYSNLESLARELSSRPLTEADQKELVAAITRAAIQSVRSGNEQFVEWKSALWNVLEANFPEVKERISDQGLAIQDVMRYFHSLPAFRPVVDKVLQGEKTHGKCAQ
jgi:hypothetical protein